MWGSGSSCDVIVLSDDEDVSVLCVEIPKNVENKENELPESIVDDDLVVTFSRRAELMPHARYDCPIQPFMATECEISAPVHNNMLFCEQCFCYICDKLAAQCKLWSSSGVCHCNSHKKSTFWNNFRNSALMGGLQSFNLTLCEIDSHLRHAETLLRSFKEELRQLFSVYLIGKPAETYQLKIQGTVHDYTPVFSYVNSFLTLAEKQDSRAGAIMQLAAAEAFVRHFAASGPCVPHQPMANVFVARMSLINRVIHSLQKQMVLGDLRSDFSHKLQEFYKKMSFPAQMKGLKNSLGVRPWDDVLLGSVLRGQNVTGVRNIKGKKDILIEQFSVVQLRLERLQQQGRYRELCRYLRVVQTDDSKNFQRLLDLMPFFLCADGQLNSAFATLMATQAARLTPSLFLCYLHIFTTATMPIRILSKHEDLCLASPWQAIKDAVPMKRIDIAGFALRVQALSPDVNNDSQCWVRVLSLLSSSPDSVHGLPEPRAEFLSESKDLVKSILLTEDNCRVIIPRHFREQYPDQALLLLYTEALAQRLHKGLIQPLLPVLDCFQNNTWAQRWLWDALSSCEHFRAFLASIEEQRDNTLDFLHALPFPSEHADQQLTGDVTKAHPQ